MGPQLFSSIRMAIKIQRTCRAYVLRKVESDLNVLVVPYDTKTSSMQHHLLFDLPYNPLALAGTDLVTGEKFSRHSIMYIIIPGDP
jgi:hypothetical protein